jgi:ABC-type lipoprotein release transport system permease subunit
MAQPGVVAASRRINTGGLASSREGAFAVGITAIEPEREEAVNLAGQNIIAGRNLTSDDGDSVLIGKGLAEAMGVGVDDRITLTGRSSHEQMRRRTMTVVGIYDLGMPDIEKLTVYVSLREAQSLYDLAGESTEVAVFLDKVGGEEDVIERLTTLLPGYEIVSFTETYPELQYALASKGQAMDIFSVIILGIAGIGILNLLLMAVYERTREIGILGALGFKPRQISALFILEGTLIGLVGVSMGVLLGLAFNGLMRATGLDFTAYSGFTSYTALITDKVYPSWGVGRLLSRALTVAIIAALAAVIPAREAAQRDPSAALHSV